MSKVRGKYEVMNKVKKQQNYALYIHELTFNRVLVQRRLIHMRGSVEIPINA